MSEDMEVYATEILDWLKKHILIEAVFWNIISIILIYVGSRILIRITNKLMSHMVIHKSRGPIKFDVRRANTIGKLINNLISYTINFITVLMILGQLGLHLGPLLAGAGVLGLAIGFGAQSLVKDVITGFFIIFEDQFGVGDVIQIDQFKGTVEEIGIRVTRLKSWTGEVHIIPNGNIKQVTNFSVHNSLAVVDVSISYESDVDKATRILKEVMTELYENSDNIMKEPEVLGVQMIGETDLKLRIIVECRPNSQGSVTRIMNAELKRRLDENGIKMRG
ncbi:mechanosensitive ion channel family protein [Paenibacillus eucommiae]|uniref:Small conductance mechanosensitive channel n=1 Tax=Paenibacillus eucommiae TaxID=1355755 RepID=A0ABS4J444_9BACL|nr:mechanosensitive ion channel family protein [Paenibacillus eucommiae]MBP1994611.1 small conductance mechanosensitive channel [Paenibacillus eucommiae]